jgi:hypothetical protein
MQIRIADNDASKNRSVEMGTREINDLATGPEPFARHL